MYIFFKNSIDIIYSWNFDESFIHKHSFTLIKKTTVISTLM